MQWPIIDIKTWFSLASFCMLSACASLLPSSQDKSLQPWTTFDEAKASYDRIEPFITDLETVQKLGFDPFKTPNLQILNHAQVVHAVVPAPIQDNGVVPPGILKCIKAQDDCKGYFMEPNRINRNRVGNFMLDFMNFKRETITTGWKFRALIVIVDDKVVYKQWSGTPNIQEESVQKNPLGPLQGLGASTGLYQQ